MAKEKCKCTRMCWKESFDAGCGDRSRVESVYDNLEIIRRRKRAVTTKLNLMQDFT